MGRTVFVGLSGGVDSAVSAALLKGQGYNVVGVFIKIWQPEFIECTWKEDRLDAMRVAAALGIPFREIDLSEQYKKDVVEKMVGDYARGITPNPDVLCNRHIKFGAFAKWAKKEGADYIATGHYAQIREYDGHFQLLRGKDAAKDQSYFLYRLGQKDLACVMFPIGGLLKTEVRQEARRLALTIAEKPDSQGLCFVGEVPMSDFLARYISVVSGPVLYAGKVIGEHHGAALYTIGQRHGFSTAHAREPGPYYVIRTDVATNTLHVSARRLDAARTSVLLEDVHWVYGKPDLPYTACAQARYHEQLVLATISQKGTRYFVTFEKPHIASPGQSLVLFLPAPAGENAGGQAGEGEMCLGGGIIAAQKGIM